MLDKITLAVTVIELIIKAISQFLEIPEAELKKQLIKDPTIDGKKSKEALELIESCLPDKK